jgi:NAD dependent epimerase/dehydratase family enzyme
LTQPKFWEKPLQNLFIRQNSGLIQVRQLITDTEPELILKSRKVISKKLEDAGFVFEYGIVEDAFKEIVG